MNSVTDYAEKVLAGDIIAGQHVKNSCKRHIKDLKRDDIYFDDDAVNRLEGFFSQVLSLSEGQFEGKPFELEPCQKFIVGSIFGWKRKDVDAHLLKWAKATEKALYRLALVFTA